MNRRALLALLLSLLVPLAALAWLGWRLADREQESVRARLGMLLTARLDESNGRLRQMFEEKERSLQSRLEAIQGRDTASLRDAFRSDADIEQVFLLDAGGGVLHPPLFGDRLPKEEEFLRRAYDFLAGEDLVYEGKTDAPAPAKGALTRSESKLSFPAKQAANASANVDGSGWFTWFAGANQHWIYWVRARDGSVLGVELHRARFLADIVAALPDSPSRAGEWESGIRARLIDAGGRQIYQWGGYDAPASLPPVAIQSPPAPVASWKFELYAAPALMEPGAAGRYRLLGTLACVAIFLAGLFTFLGREISRDLREARQRVTFVNQVSHELKTPLTSIRMYAEMMEDELPEEAEPERRHLGVIVAESQRLARLIDNVLTFGRERERRLKLQFRPASVDEVVRRVLEQLRPSLDSAGIAVETDLHAPEPIECDPDAVGQILVNLASNVEKYAAAGGWMRLSTIGEGAGVLLRVEDRGPGIPAEDRERIFTAFVRLDDRIASVAAGTGIGLTISRHLALLHGGSLRVADRSGGACFELSLPGRRPVES